MTDQERSKHIIEKLDLKPHPEGGFYREIYRNEEIVSRADGESRNAGTAIYFLLPEGICTDWHQLEVDELWHFYEGSDLFLEIISPDGKFQQFALGAAQDNGRSYQQLVPKNYWQRSYSIGAFTLVGCTVTPGFEFDDFEKISKRDLAKQYPDISPKINYKPFSD